MKQERRFIVDILFVLALFGVFAVSALILVTIGADVYQHTVQDMNCNYETRTAISYLTEKVRQNDIYSDENNNGICLTTLDDTPALMLTQNYEDTEYCTYLYLHEGYLKELFMQKGYSLGGSTLDAGVNIMALDTLHMEQITSSLLSVEMTTTEGGCHQIYVSTHCNVN